MRKIKNILFIIVTFLFVSINVYACTADDGCINCANETSKTECKKNIKIAIYGDSISTYEGYINGIDGDATYMSYYSSRDMSLGETWWARLANMRGWRVVANDSIGSTRVTWDGTTTNDNERIGEKYYMAGDYRTTSVGSKGTPNKIFIFAGVNDIFSEDVPIGTVGNAHLKNDAIFANAYYSMLQKLKTKYPKTEITCIAPYIPKYLKDNTVSRTNQIDDVIIQLAKNNGVNYVDLRKVNFVNEDFIEGIHPSSSGMEKIANAVSDSIFENPIIQQDNSNNNSNASQNSNVIKKNEVNFDVDLNFCASTASIWQIVGWVFLIVKIIVPLLLIIFGIKDLAQAVISGKYDGIKNATKSLFIRGISAILIFFVPTIVSLIMGLVVDFTSSGAKADYDICETCILNPSKCDTSKDVGKQ